MVGHLQEVCAREQPVLYPTKNEEIYMALFHIKTFSYQVLATLLHLKRKLQHLGHK